ncbi:MAG: intradiol ring-cleavage dioxygenase, partial [Polyangiales bacterium]
GAGTAAAGSCEEVPEETAGPYPADGSNGIGSGGPPGSGGSTNANTINALILSGIVRSDIRSSFGSSTTRAEGVSLAIKLRIVRADDNCVPLADAAVYLWHCDRSGNYSLYSDAITSENYLRGVQITDADGYVTFESIFPACYSGRWPHIHFEVYPDMDSATIASNAIKTSQIALPKAACDTVYASDGYATSITNLNQVSLDNDNVFDDGYDLQLGTVTGSVESGYEVSLTAGVAASG